MAPRHKIVKNEKNVKLLSVSFDLKHQWRRCGGGRERKFLHRSYNAQEIYNMFEKNDSNYIKIP